MDYNSAGSGDGIDTISSGEQHEQNGCEKIFEIGSEEENEESCPAIKLGFDITIQLKAGVNIASLVTVYGLVALEIPFRITLPETDDSTLIQYVRVQMFNVAVTIIYKCHLLWVH